LQPINNMGWIKSQKSALLITLHMCGCNWREWNILNYIHVHTYIKLILFLVLQPYMDAQENIVLISINLNHSFELWGWDSLLYISYQYELMIKWVIFCVVSRNMRDGDSFCRERESI